VTAALPAAPATVLPGDTGKQREMMLAGVNLNPDGTPVNWTGMPLPLPAREAVRAGLPIAVSTTGTGELDAVVVPPGMWCEIVRQHATQPAPAPFQGGTVVCNPEPDLHRNIGPH